MGSQKRSANDLQGVRNDRQELDIFNVNQGGRETVRQNINIPHRSFLGYQPVFLPEGGAVVRGDVFPTTIHHEARSDEVVNYQADGELVGDWLLLVFDQPHHPFQPRDRYKISATYDGFSWTNRATLSGADSMSVLGNLGGTFLTKEVDFQTVVRADLSASDFDLQTGQTASPLFSGGQAEGATVAPTFIGVDADEKALILDREPDVDTKLTNINTVSVTDQIVSLDLDSADPDFQFIKVGEKIDVFLTELPELEGAREVLSIVGSVVTVYAPVSNLGPFTPSSGLRLVRAWSFRVFGYMFLWETVRVFFFDSPTPPNSGEVDVDITLDNIEIWRSPFVH